MGSIDQSGPQAEAEWLDKIVLNCNYHHKYQSHYNFNNIAAEMLPIWQVKIRSIFKNSFDSMFTGYTLLILLALK